MWEGCHSDRVLGKTSKRRWHSIKDLKEGQEESQPCKGKAMDVMELNCAEALR